MGYFDPAYFDPAYFDTGPAVTGGRPPRRILPIQPEPALTDDEDGLLMVLIL